MVADFLPKAVTAETKIPMVLPENRAELAAVEQDMEITLAAAAATACVS